MIYGYHKFSLEDNHSSDLYRRSIQNAIIDAQHLRWNDEVHFDDGTESAYRLGLPVFERANKQVTFFIVPGWLGKPGYMTWNDVLDVVARGHAIAAHTYDHLDLRQISIDSAHDQIVRCVRVLEDVINRPVQRFVAPFERYNKDILKLIQKLELRPILNRVAMYSHSDITNMPPRVALDPASQTALVAASGLSCEEVAEFRVEDIPVYMRTLGL